VHDPKRCAVIEDTVTGVSAGLAAGATVFGYSPPEGGHDVPAVLMQAGAVAIFEEMADLAALLSEPGAHAGMPFVR
jgi:beta-phosphoglucomutase-like phosphatase (HAD superfamily)